MELPTDVLETLISQLADRSYWTIVGKRTPDGEGAFEDRAFVVAAPTMWAKRACYAEAAKYRRIETRTGRERWVNIPTESSLFLHVFAENQLTQDCRTLDAASDYFEVRVLSGPVDVASILRAYDIVTQLFSADKPSFNGEDITPILRQFSLGDLSGAAYAMDATADEETIRFGFEAPDRTDLGFSIEVKRFRSDEFTWTDFSTAIM